MTTATRLLVYGLMRSGTTLVCDLLTIPERSLVLSEPMLFAPWRDRRAKAVHGIARAFGLDVGEDPPDEADFEDFADYFARELEPHLNRLELWGIKEVMLYNWQDELRRHRPDRLVLCVRDLRDVTLSALDLIAGSKLAFTDKKQLRDEAWLASRLTYDLREMTELHQQPHFLLRYEDLVSDPTMPQRLADYLGMERLGSGDLHRASGAEGTRKRELKKHGAGVSDRAVARHEHETDSRALAFATTVADTLSHFASSFGYSDHTPFHNAPVHRTPELERYQAEIHMADVEDPIAAGPAGYDPAFALRRARRTIARNISPGTGVAELGPLLPGLKYLLPEGCSYIGFAGTARLPEIEKADWQSGRLPEGHDIGLIALVGSLEFADEPVGLLGALLAQDLELLFTYHASDDTDGLDRVRLGWRNHLSRRDLSAAFESLGAKSKSLWAFDGYQSLFRLRSGQ